MPIVFPKSASRSLLHKGGATQAMWDIVEERQRSRCPPAAAPPGLPALRIANFYVTFSHV
jgi:hypothetical protein